MKCKTKYCRNKPPKGRRKCSKCRSREHKESNPFQYHYTKAKHNARRRKIPFHLTLEEYKEIWEQSGKWQAKLEGKNFSMDRINVNEGYHRTNIRIVSMLMNVEVWHDSQKWQVDFRWRKMWSERNGKPPEDCPF